MVNQILGSLLLPELKTLSQLFSISRQFCILIGLICVNIIICKLWYYQWLFISHKKYYKATSNQHHNSGFGERKFHFPIQLQVDPEKHHKFSQYKCCIFFLHKPFSGFLRKSQAKWKNIHRFEKFTQPWFADLCVFPVICSFVKKSIPPVHFLQTLYSMHGEPPHTMSTFCLAHRLGPSSI